MFWDFISYFCFSKLSKASWKLFWRFYLQFRNSLINLSKVLDYSNVSSLVCLKSLIWSQVLFCASVYWNAILNHSPMLLKCDTIKINKRNSIEKFLFQTVQHKPVHGLLSSKTNTRVASLTKSDVKAKRKFYNKRSKKSSKSHILMRTAILASRYFLSFLVFPFIYCLCF